MRIGIDARKIGPTGIGRYVTELLLEFIADPKSQVEWHLFVLPESRSLIPAAILNSKKVMIHNTNAGYYSLAERFLFAKEIDRLGLDLIHFPNFNIPFGLKTKAVTTIHDLTLLYYPGRRMFWGKRWFYRLVLAWALKKSTAIMTDSRDAASDIRQFAKQRNIALQQRLQVVYLGVNKYFSAKVTKREIKHQLKLLSLVNPYYLVVASDLVHKNVIRTLKAFTLTVSQKSTIPHKLVLVGRFERGGLVERFIESHPILKDRVLIVGAVSNEILRALYAEATGLVFCSLKEGFGLPILEAYSVGCPVITSSTSSMKEIAGEAAYLANPNNEDSISKAMVKLLNLKKDGRELKKRLAIGKEIANSYSWRKTAQQVMTVYLNACHKKESS